jgi:hypothetical protein
MQATDLSGSIDKLVSSIADDEAWAVYDISGWIGVNFSEFASCAGRCEICEYACAIIAFNDNL